MPPVIGGSPTRHTCRSLAHGAISTGPVNQHGQVIDVLLSARRDLAAARRFFTRALRAGTVPAEVTTARAHVYPRVLDELVPSALHIVEAVREQSGRGRSRAAKGPAAADARPEESSVSADPRRWSRPRAEPAPRSLRHRCRSPQPPQASRGIRRPRARHLNPPEHPDHAPTLFREGTTQQCPSDEDRSPGQILCASSGTLQAHRGGRRAAASHSTGVILPGRPAARGRHRCEGRRDGWPRCRRTLCVPKTLSTSCDQAVFVDQATDASLPSDAVVLKVDRFG